MFLLNHIAIISSSEESIHFYRKLGFLEEHRNERGYDTVVYLSNGLLVLEIYIDGTHPKRLTNPEALGLRHICFSVENIEEIARIYKVEIKNDEKGRFLFIYDPDYLPIEIREYKPAMPEEF